MLSRHSSRISNGVGSFLPATMQGALRSRAGCRRYSIIYFRARLNTRAFVRITAAVIKRRMLALEGQAKVDVTAASDTHRITATPGSGMMFAALSSRRRGEYGADEHLLTPPHSQLTVPAVRNRA